jgi:hypothetical protein
LGCGLVTDQFIIKSKVGFEVGTKRGVKEITQNNRKIIGISKVFPGCEIGFLF